MTVAVVVQLDKMPELGGHELCCVALIGAVVGIVLDMLVGLLVGVFTEELVDMLIRVLFVVLVGEIGGVLLLVELTFTDGTGVVGIGILEALVESWAPPVQEKL
jgi:tetrahydromethanopterin S-methyltransferase subunit C